MRSIPSLIPPGGIFLKIIKMKIHINCKIYPIKVELSIEPHIFYTRIPIITIAYNAINP